MQFPAFFNQLYHMNVRIAFRGICLSLLFCCGLSLASHAAELRGTVYDSTTAVALSEATVNLIPTGGGPALEAQSDVVGRYELTGIGAGEYTLTASRPGYLPFSETRTYGPAELASEDIPLVPDPGISDRIDLFLLARDTSTMSPLESVPVRIRRFDLIDPGILEQTIYGTTDADGMVSLPGQPAGHYTFRFNHFDDGTPLIYYNSLSNTTKNKLEKPHTVVAQLLSIKQTLKVTVTGPDPVIPEAGAVPLKNVFVELTGVNPDFTPPSGFDPLADDLFNYAIPVLPTFVGKTDEFGEATFENLAPTKYIVDARKFGYMGPQTLVSPDASGALPATHPHGLDLEPVLLEVFITSPYAGSHVALSGLAVKLEGIDELEGSSTEGIERLEPVTPIPPDGEFPGGAVRVEFTSLLPGRYRVSFDQVLSSPPFPALEDGVGTIDFRFKGSDTIEVPLGFNGHVMEAEVVPATIRGRFHIADDRSTVPPTPDAAPSPASRWKGPAYKLAAQDGIEITQSVLAPILPPGIDIISVDADEDGTFSLSVLPGFYGIKIPSLDGYWGSNYRSVDRVTGETFAYGWPYATDPGTTSIPAHPFGSRGIPISSGDDLELDLFVRKQLYFLDGLLTKDSGVGALFSPALDRVVARTGTGTTHLVTEFSHLAAPGVGVVKFDENDAAPPAEVSSPILQGMTTWPDGSELPNVGGEFLIKAPPGTHKVTVEHPHYAFPSGFSDIIALPDYGFVGEGSDGSGIIPMEDNWAQVSAVQSLIDPYTTDYLGDFALLIRFWGKDSEDDPVIRESRVAPHYFKHPGLGDRLFSASQLDPLYMTAGDWTIWVEKDGDWYERSFTIPAGPPDTVTIDFNLAAEYPELPGPTVVANAPMPTYDFSLKAVNADNRSHEIGAIDVEMVDATSRTVPYTNSAETDSYEPASITGGLNSAKWLPPSGDPATPAYLLDVNAQTAVPTVETTLLLVRGSQVKGVLSAELPNPPDSPVSKPVEGVRLTIRDRHGNFLRDLEPTDGDGNFDTRPAAIPRSEVLFLDVSLPGYERQLIRLASGPATPDDGDDLDFDAGTLSLKPLPAPGITNTASILDRRGPFIVGLRKGKDGGVTGNDPAVEMTWEVIADTDPEHMYSLANYDSPSGTVSPAASVSIKDPVRNFWIVDPRSFDGNPLSVAPDPVIVPLAVDMAADPNPLFNHEMRAFLSGLRETVVPPGEPPPPVEPVYPNLFSISRENLANMLVEGRLKTEATGIIDLASLYPGRFLPWIIAETGHGAFAAHQWKRSGTDPLYADLYGMKLPSWLSTFADTLGTVAAAQESGGGLTVSLQRAFPSGLFEFEPVLDADITVTPDDTLNYDYKVAAKFSLGEKTPGNGVLGMGSGFAGLRVRGQVEVGLSGSKLYYDSSDNPLRVLGTEPVFTVGGGVGGGFTIGDLADKSAYEPNLPGFKPSKSSLINAKLKADASAALEAEVPLSVPHTAGKEITPLETRLNLTAGGGVGIEVEGDVLRALYRSISATGPWAAALAAVRESELAKITLFAEPRGGAAFQRTLITRYSDKAAGNADFPNAYQDDKVLGVRNFAIGEEFVPIIDVDRLRSMVLLGFASGIRLEAAWGVLGAEAKIETAGSDNPVIGFPSLELEVNKFGDSPMIKSVSGSVDASVKVEIDAWVAKLSRETKLASYPVNRSFNTEAQFFLVEMDVTDSGIDLATATESVWCGSPPHLVADYFPLSGYAASGGTLAFLTPDPVGGGMKLKVALESASVWSPPVEIASAGAFLGVAMHPMSGGGWMLAWSEIGSGDLSAFSPSTTIRYATSLDAITWTAPSTLASVPGTVFDLRLLPMPGGDLGLLWLESERGPGATVLDLEGAVFSTGAWGSASTLFDDFKLAGWDAAGPGFTGVGPAQILAYTDPGGLVAIGWDGSAVSPAVGLDGTATGSECAIVSGPADTFFAAFEDPGGGIGLFSKTGSGSWNALPTIPSAVPLDLGLCAVDDGGTVHYCLAWSTGAITANLSFAWIDGSGSLLAGPLQLFSDTPGYYDAVVPVPVPGIHEANLFSLFDNQGQHELRTFRVSESAGVIATDRDGDLLDDHEELRIVDALHDDLIKKIDDVLSLDDFDEDGYSNAVELAAGTDPIDPDSFPGQLVEVVTTSDTGHELGLVPAEFLITRTGDPSSVLTVHYTLSGSAVNGVDYTTTSTSVTLPDGASVVAVPVQPIADGEVEGAESVMMTLAPDAAYVIGSAVDAMATIMDAPLDQWRFVEFTPAELADPQVSGLDADAESDSLVTLLEYAFGKKPKLNDGAGLVFAGVVEEAGSGNRHLAIVYRRLKSAEDVIFQIRFGTDLASWTVASPEEVEEISVVDNGDGTETVTVRDLASLETSPRRFMDVKVVRTAGSVP